MTDEGVHAWAGAEITIVELRELSSWLLRPKRLVMFSINFLWLLILCILLIGAILGNLMTKGDKAGEVWGCVHENMEVDMTHPPAPFHVNRGYFPWYLEDNVKVWFSRDHYTRKEGQRETLHRIESHQSSVKEGTAGTLQKRYKIAQARDNKKERVYSMITWRIKW